MPAERDAEHEVLRYRNACPLRAVGGKDVCRQVVEELAGVDGGAVVDAEHVGSVARVGLLGGAPGFVGQRGDLAGAVVALVEGDGYQASFGDAGVVIGSGVGVPGGDDVGGERGHGGLGCEAGVEEPEAGEFGGRGGQFG